MVYSIAHHVLKNEKKIMVLLDDLLQLDNVGVIQSTKRLQKKTILK